MSKFRLYILVALACVVIVELIGFRLLDRHGVYRTDALRRFLFIAGSVLVLDTILVMYLSNFNLGVILPAFFGVPLIALGFLLPYTDHGILRVLKWAAAVCYAIAALIFLVCGILMVKATHEGQDRSADAVIVLGAAVHGDRVTWILSNRLDAAIDYAEEHPETVLVVSGGRGDGETVTEASAMRKYLLEHGIAEERIIAEERATSTVENFLYSTELIHERLGEDATVGFVTTAFHCYRAGAVARQLGIDTFAVPAKDVWYIGLNNFLRECVGICVYALRGSI